MVRISSRSSASSRRSTDRGGPARLDAPGQIAGFFGNLVTSALKSADYKCDLSKSAPTASGQTPITCTKVDQTKQFLIFSTKPLCEKERPTQAANGD
jgi:hypothetical protein